MGADAELVTLQTYEASWSAHVDRLRLEQEGVVCFVIDEHDHHGGPMPAFAVKLQVPASQVSEARRILASKQQQ